MDPLQIYWKERKAKLSPEINSKLDELLKKGHMTDELIFIQRKRPKLQKGDVFVVQPRENIYFYGLILNVVSTPSCNCKIFACIFKNITHEKNMDNFRPDFNNLLLPPILLIKEPWTSGYFFNVGRINLDEIDVPTYGFYHDYTNCIFSDLNERLNYYPSLIGLLMYSGIGAVACEIESELIINPNLLLDDQPPSQSDFCIKFPEIIKRKGINY
ncbi:MAG: hypothetical protein IJC90_06765 [Clostridia bacterium]|nr:hypothetical protein [Clostridia bacterium]